MVANCHVHFISALEELAANQWTLWDGEKTWQTVNQLAVDSTKEEGVFRTSKKRIAWMRGRLKLPSGKVLQYLAWDQYVNTRGMTNRDREQLGHLVF